MGLGVRIAAAAAALAIVGTAAASPYSRGYLGDNGPDTIRVVPPAPKPGDARDRADKAEFLALRKLNDTPRWTLAQRDIDEAKIVQDMTCALGVALTQQNAPKTLAVISRVSFDVRRAVDLPKDFYKRPRPFVLYPGHPIYLTPDAGLNHSPDYPSGHSTWSWTVGSILAELAPDRAVDILARARAFAEGRMIGGVHSLSAIEEGRTNAAVLVTALHGDAQFRADMDAARPEIAAARAAGPAPDAAECRREAELVKSPL